MPDNARAIRLRVGENVRQLRTVRRLSQERLAELAGKNVKHVGQIERGQVNMGINVLADLAMALKVDVAALFVDGASSRRGDRRKFAVTARDLEQIEQFVRKARSSPVSGDLD
jgi:transcriptional regulator with XRE-family HTH domain